MKDQSVRSNFQKGRAPPRNEKPAGVGSAHGFTQNSKYHTGTIVQFQAKGKTPYPVDIATYLEMTLAKIRLFARVLKDRGFSDLAKLTLGELLFDFHNTEDGRCDPAAKTIGERLDRDERTIRRGIKELTCNGVVVMRRRKTSPEYKFPELEMQERTKPPGLGTRAATEMFVPETQDRAKSPSLDAQSGQGRTKSPDKPLSLRIINNALEGESAREEAEQTALSIHAARPLAFEECSPAAVPDVTRLATAKVSQIEIIAPTAVPIWEYAISEPERQYARAIGLSDAEIERETIKLIERRKTNPGCGTFTWFDRAAEWKKRHPDQSQTAGSVIDAANRLIAELDRCEAMGLGSAAAPESSVILNKESQSKLWRKVEELRGRPSPTNRDGNWFFPKSLVDQAQRELGDG